MSDFEVSPQPQQILNAFEGAFSDIKAQIEAPPSQERQKQRANTTPIATGVQNLLIQLLLQLARKLGLKEDELEKVFDEVLKLISTYKNKKAEV